MRGVVWLGKIRPVSLRESAGISMVVRLFADWSGAAVPVARPDAASRTTDKHEES